jgi:hypothetical protein
MKVSHQTIITLIQVVTAVVAICLLVKCQMYFDY